MVEITTYTENRGDITYVTSSHLDKITVANEVANSEVENELLIQKQIIEDYIIRNGN
jgi:hypothetical protein